MKSTVILSSVLLLVLLAAPMFSLPTVEKSENELQQISDDLKQPVIDNELMKRDISPGMFSNASLVT